MKTDYQKTGERVVAYEQADWKRTGRSTTAEVGKRRAIDASFREGGATSLSHISRSYRRWPYGISRRSNRRSRPHFDATLYGERSRAISVRRYGWYRRWRKTSSSSGIAVVASARVPKPYSRILTMYAILRTRRCHHAPGRFEWTFYISPQSGVGSVLWETSSFFLGERAEGF